MKRIYKIKYEKSDTSNVGRYVSSEIEEEENND